MSAPDPAGFTWSRAGRHAGIVFALILAAGAAVSMAGVVESPYRFGVGLGRFSAFAMMVTVGISWLAQTGRRAWALALGLGTVAALSALALWLAGQLGPTISAQDRAALEVVEDGGVRRLVHPRRRFSIVHPGDGFQPCPEVATALTGGQGARDMHAWAYRDARTGETVALLLVGGLRSRTDVTAFIRGLTESAMGGDAIVGKRELTWDDDHREIRIDLAHIRGGHVNIRGLGVPSSDSGRSDLVVVLAMLQGPSDTERLLASLTVQ